MWRGCVCGGDGLILRGGIWDALCWVRLRLGGFLALLVHRLLVVGAWVEVECRPWEEVEASRLMEPHQALAWVVEEATSPREEA